MVMMYMVNYVSNQDGQVKQGVYGEIKKDSIIHNSKQHLIIILLGMEHTEMLMAISG